MMVVVYTDLENKIKWYVFYFILYDYRDLLKPVCCVCRSVLSATVISREGASVSPLVVLTVSTWDACPVGAVTATVVLCAARPSGPSNHWKPWKPWTTRRRNSCVWGPVLAGGPWLLGP